MRFSLYNILWICSIVSTTIFISIILSVGNNDYTVSEIIGDDTKAALGVLTSLILFTPGALAYCVLLKPFIRRSHYQVTLYLHVGALVALYIMLYLSVQEFYTEHNVFAYMAFILIVLSDILIVTETENQRVTLTMISLTMTMIISVFLMIFGFTYESNWSEYVAIALILIVRPIRLMIFGLFVKTKRYDIEFRILNSPMEYYGSLPTIIEADDEDDEPKVTTKGHINGFF